MYTGDRATLAAMDKQALLKEVEDEIARLRKVADLLRGTSKASGGHGRRKLSKEAREKIAAAQRARWAKAKRKSAG